MNSLTSRDAASGDTLRISTGGRLRCEIRKRMRATIIKQMMINHAWTNLLSPQSHWAIRRLQADLLPDSSFRSPEDPPKAYQANNHYLIKADATTHGWRL